MEDISAIMNDDLYKRDILIAVKKISTSPYLEERVQAMLDLGHFAWLGGPAVAKFAAIHLMEFANLLVNEDTPLELKKQTLNAIIEICACVQENRDKAREVGLLPILFNLLDSPEVDLRLGVTACLVILINENFDNHKTVLNMKGIKEKLLKILQDDWSTRKRNEASRLLMMLWLNRAENVQPNQEGNCSKLTKT